MKTAFIVTLLLTMLGLAAPASAQSRFAPVIQVGDRVITQYQLDQRTLFLSLLRAGDNPRELAREQLINEAIQIAAAEADGVAPTPEAIAEAQSEFAGRANLTTEEFVTALGQNGVGAETFRDFVTAGIAWRDLVRGRFAQTARDIPRQQVERTLAQTGTEGGLRVLVSEILLPATTPETTRASRERAAALSRVEGEAEFAAMARQFSVAASRNRGGALDWVAIETLPPEIQPVIAGLTPGQVSRPIELGNAIGIFLLRDLERVPAGTPENFSVDYALLVPGGSGLTAAEAAAEADSCDDLYGIAHDLPPEALTRETVALERLPADLRAAIDLLDVDESTTALTRNGQPALLMLCGRRPTLESGVDLSLVGTQLLNARIGGLAAQYLAELKANTFIDDLTD